MASTTFNNPVIREQLANTMSRLSPEENPLRSRIKKFKTGNLLVEWGVNDLREDGFGPEAQGVDIVNYDNQHVNLARLSNYVQKFTTTAAVSEEDLASDTAGIANKLSDAIMLAGKQLNNKIEMMIGSDQAKASPNQSGGLGYWISNSISSSDVPTEYKTVSGADITTAIASTDADTIDDVLTSIYEATGRSATYDLVCGTTFRKAMSDILNPSSGSLRQNIDANDEKYKRVLSIYESNYGMVRVYTDLFLARTVATGASTAASQRRAYFLDMSQLSIAELKAQYIQKPEFNGGNFKAFIRAYAGLCVKLPKALGKSVPSA